VYGYAPGENYAGDADAVVFALGPAGDVDRSGTVDSLDVVAVRSWLMEQGSEPLNPDAMDVTGDGRVDLADLTRLIDHVYAGQPLSCDSSVIGAPYLLRYSQWNDTTTVLLHPPIRGIKVVLLGSGSGLPISAAPPGVELLTTQNGDSLVVWLADLDGDTRINQVVAFRIAGTYAVVGGAVADVNYRSSAVTVSGPVGVADVGLPRSVELNVYPNPSRGQASVHFAVPVRAKVRLSVHDLAGRTIRTLTDATLDRGWHDAGWDGTNDHGARVAPGVYFFRLTLNSAVTAESVALRRVVLVR
jgi:hypothetical protein